MVCYSMTQMILPINIIYGISSISFTWFPLVHCLLIQNSVILDLLTVCNISSCILLVISAASLFRALADRPKMVRQVGI